MTFLLSKQNVGDYLIARGVCQPTTKDILKIEPKIAKNFNLLVNLSDAAPILVKQEPINREGKAAGEFAREWRIRQFITHNSHLSYWHDWLPAIVDFDSDNSILAIAYFEDYQNLADFYNQENSYPSEIAQEIGTIIATIHRETFNNQQDQHFFQQNNQEHHYLPDLLQSLAKIPPEIFGKIPSDGIKFLTLYQRYASLAQAIVELETSFQPCCLVHNDLKLNNWLIPFDWQPKTVPKLKLIDWERSSWGDPAYDLGMLISSYLCCWLSSLVVSKTIAIQESLSLAMTPLELIQPSLNNLVTAYQTNFPEISQQQPDFLARSIQFAGLALIHTIQSMLQYQKTFNNTGICMLQVAKTLLCRPEASMATLFGGAII